MLRPCINQLFFEYVVIIVKNIISLRFVIHLSGLDILVRLTEHDALNDNFIFGFLKSNKTVQLDKFSDCIEITSSHFFFEMGFEVDCILFFDMCVLEVVKSLKLVA